MKKTKQLPKEFTFICDEHSREQLESLGVKLNGWAVDAIGEQYAVIRNGVCSYRSGLTLISLSDYIDQPETKPTNATEQKWQEKTRGGYKFNIIRENRGDGIMSVEILMNDNTWMVHYHYQNGRYKDEPHELDLLPSRRTEIEQRLAEIDKEIEKLQKELNNLK